MAEGEDYKVLNVHKDSYKDYQNIINLPAFKKIGGINNKHLFILSMSLGFKNNRYLPLKSGEKHSGGYCRVESLSDEDKSLIKSMAICKTKELNILIDPKQIYQIAEGYANGGISILKELVTQHGDFFINLTNVCR